MSDHKYDELLVAPVRLRWNPEQNQLVTDSRSAESKLGGAAVEGHAAALAERGELFANSTEKLTDEVEAIFDKGSMNNAGSSTALPVRHAAGDMSVPAKDETWRIKGMTSGGDVILGETHGIISKIKSLQDPMEAATATSALPDYDYGRDRRDQPVEDDGNPVYITSVDDLAAAKGAWDKAWAAPLSQAEKEQSAAWFAGLKAEADAHDVVLDARLHDWANDPRHAANGGDGIIEPNDPRGDKL